MKLGRLKPQYLYYPELDESRVGILESGSLILSEIERSLIISLQGKPPAIHSQSIRSDVSDGINIDSSQAKCRAFN